MVNFAGQQSKTPAGGSSEQHSRGAGVKETIESILVAFILAFVFRAFVVEAFVIPSGSMAPTLLGAHMRFRCEDCGYRFDLNYPAGGMDESVSIPSVAGPDRGLDTVFPVHCPNCGMKVQKDTPDRKYSAANTTVHYGDRILVLKYIYLLQEPRRWDVVVFKAPEQRARYDYGQNYIKRLVGRPGETVMILDGDVYVCPNRHAVADAPMRYWPWEVQPKPWAAQEALWRVVFDNDFCPQNSERRQRLHGAWVNPWQQREGQGWSFTGADGRPRVLVFDNPDGSGTLFFNRDANRGTYPFTDWLPYNETKHLVPRGNHFHIDPYGQERIPRWNVSDVKVQFYYQRQAGDGPLKVALTKLGDTFIAELHPGEARLVRRRETGERVVLGTHPLKQGSWPIRVEFMNVDYRVTLRVDGVEIIQTTPEQYRPNVGGPGGLLERHEQRMRLARNGASPEEIRNVFPPPRVELIGERQRAVITHLSLWRDVYYTPSYNSYAEEIEHGSPARPIRLHVRGEVDAEGRICDNEYFVLGDNSIQSNDARAWREPVELWDGEMLEAGSGRVPERFLLGKAFFVYWPAGFRPISREAPDVIPNFGGMRFIH